MSMLNVAIGQNAAFECQEVGNGKIDQDTASVSEGIRVLNWALI